RCYHLKAKGASYDVEREDMVSSTDTWFRPSDICVAPDGAVFIADWYDPGVGGHNIGDTTMGRVFRLAPTGNKPAVPKVDLTTNNGTLEALGSPALSVRYMAQAKLRGMSLADATKALKEAIDDTKKPILRARALWMLYGRSDIEKKDLLAQAEKLLGEKD